MAVEKLLALMADGAFHSGEELGQLLGVSRTAVWKQLHKLDELGLRVESVKGRGYRLLDPVELLEEGVIREALHESVGALIRAIELPGVIESTNARGGEHARAGGAGGFVCAAEQQTAGRGRRGRPWVSPFGANLYFSLVWEFQGGAASLGGLSLLVGLGIARLLERYGIGSVGLKWPNDVLCDQKKIAGILLEMHGDAAGACHVVIGVGLNVAMPEQVAEIDQPWADMRRTAGGQVSRNRLLAEALNELVPLLQQFEDAGFGAFREDWQRYDIFRDQRVKLQLGDALITGVALGVDESGGLRLRTDEGEQVFYGGEASLRRLL